MPFLEVATSVRGVVQFLVALGKINVVDCQADPALWAELKRRCEARDSIVYTPDRGRRGSRARAPDRWSCLSVLVERTGKDEAIHGDCEDLAALWAAHLLLGGFRVAACITQPREGATAHAYLRVFDAAAGQWRVWDPAVWHGMRAPGVEFYTSGETHCCELEMPC